MRVLSATENIDTFNENDDLIIGFKGLVNDFFARDSSRCVRTGYFFPVIVERDTWDHVQKS